MKRCEEHYEPIRKLFELCAEPEEWDVFVERTQLKRISQGTHLVRAGDGVKHAYFCSVGLFRLYYALDDGKEYNKSFSRAPDFVTSYGAMIRGTPSYFSIQALEDSAVIEVPYALLRELTDRSHSWERFVRHSVEQLYLKKEERERQLLYLDAEERLRLFRDKYPGLENRIPQYHIASYLGISPVSLSRIVNRQRN
ncbi:Crp/Fnr family transcriptional regulator [Paenibacillus hemerocallicola]|jgi:CRP-like cAMP-binding protein|uniref:Crp/Fnr family transcriptional regulator n=1 Tax=Paenibacillus hemerocallicola TaxID=1172614 RepID=A0A5C4T9B5_9BACL|nr:Crp/Fnr family transcriptional regulator [Paenibacillus hemerocallicola]TNJ65492.1 Crp/Fnr family transcriptional regulator [Paenibacillus hemerocallicola]